MRLNRSPMSLFSTEALSLLLDSRLPVVFEKIYIERLSLRHGFEGVFGNNVKKRIIYDDIDERVSMRSIAVHLTE
jgi:hypothetical protein